MNIDIILNYLYNLINNNYKYYMNSNNENIYINSHTLTRKYSDSSQE